MEPVKAFTIDRATWLHGEGSEDSYLIRSRDSKKCCLGFYLENCGLPEEYLTDKMTPSYCNVEMNARTPDWLLDENKLGVSWACQVLMNTNDDTTNSRSEKEASIIAGFKAVGIEVSFTGSYGK
jgi:hypothetical protein